MEKTITKMICDLFLQTFEDRNIKFFVNLTDDAMMFIRKEEDCTLIVMQVGVPDKIIKKEAYFYNDSEIINYDTRQLISEDLLINKIMDYYNEYF
jgi:hypothetical protein